MTTLLIATRNGHKVGEIRSILGPACRFLTLNEFPEAPAVVEDAPTFAGNALKKATALARWLARGRSGASAARPGDPRARLAPSPADFVLADDSGLEVDVLDGAPGVHSARFAALGGAASGAATGNSPDADNNAKLLRLLAGVPPIRRTARFRCVLALVAVPDETAQNASPVCWADDLAAQTFEGACEGRIQAAPRGQGGFGYDPLFVPDGFTQSFAELGEEVKNRLSHRARALAALRRFLGGRP